MNCGGVSRQLLQAQLSHQAGLFPVKCERKKVLTFPAIASCSIEEKAYQHRLLGDWQQTAGPLTQHPHVYVERTPVIFTVCASRALQPVTKPPPSFIAVL